MNQVKSIVFNHSHKLLCLFSGFGFQIYTVSEFKSILINSIGVKHFSFIYDTMMFIIVGDQEEGPYSQSKLHIWDDGEIIDTTDFNHKILKLICLKEFVAVFSEKRTVLYNLTKKCTLRFINHSINCDIISSSLCYDTAIFCYRSNPTVLAFLNFWIPNSSPLQIQTQKVIHSVKMNYTGELVAITYEDSASIFSVLEGSIISTIEGVQIRAMHFTRDNDYFIYLASEMDQQINKLRIRVVESQVCLYEAEIDLVDTKVQITSITLDKDNIKIFIYGDQLFLIYILKYEQGQFILQDKQQNDKLFIGV